MKVVLVSRLFAPEVAAAAFRLKALADALAASGHQVTVLTTAPPATATIDDSSRYDVRRWPVLRDNGGNVRGYVQYASYDIPLSARLVFRSADVVISEPPPTTGTVTALVCALKRIPYYYYAADIWSDAVAAIEAPKIVTGLMRLLERVALSRARGVIAVSEGVAERVRELGVPNKRIKVVPNGVDTSIFRADLKSMDSDCPYFIYTGTMSEWQGAEIFIRALPFVLERHPKARIAFFGQGAEESRLRALAAEVAPDNVEFGGVVPPAEAAHWISGAAGALVSIVPGQGYDFAKPTKIFAAAACGTPVLFAGTNANASAKLIQENSLGVIAEYTPESVAERMLALLNEYRHDGAQASSWVQHHASLANTGRQAAQWITDDSSAVTSNVL